jgi:hyperosmotically inducible protein
MYQLIRLLLSIIIILNLGCGYASDLKTIEQSLSDSVITAKIRAKFTKDIHLNPLKIFVSTDKGVVTLRGHIKDKAAFINALRLAKATKGVKIVDADELEIKQVNTTFTDAYITAKVEAAILKAKVLDDESIPLVGINATTNNGVVTLSGDVKHHESIPPLLKRTLAVKGVKQLISNLRVAESNNKSDQTQSEHKP